jgi:biotin-[acetyl-CoA-carboxylase] ligase BirA-like protein
MIVITNYEEMIFHLFGDNFLVIPDCQIPIEIAESASLILGDNGLVCFDLPEIKNWNYLLITNYAPTSQYDALISLMLAQKVVDKTLCLAISGSEFHGFRNRSWSAMPGNLHLSVYLEPNIPAIKAGSSFLAMSAVSVAETINKIPGILTEARIKWVNDIMIGPAKVGGVLAHSRIQGNDINGIVLGIGTNVESTPSIEITETVPSATSINDHLPIFERIELKDFFFMVIDTLEENYNLVLNKGAENIINKYTSLSNFIGKNVSIVSDPVVGSPELLFKGQVKSLGTNLELLFHDSDFKAVNGRMILLDE